MLLGIKIAPKEDSRCSLAELVYITPLTVPGDFIANHDHHADHSFQLQCMRDQVRLLAPIPPSQHGTASASAGEGLQWVKLVFTHHDIHHTPHRYRLKLAHQDVHSATPAATQCKCHNTPDLVALSYRPNHYISVRGVGVV